MIGSGVAITMYYVLAAGLRAVLERWLAVFDYSHQISCGASLGSGLAFRHFWHL